MHLAAGAEGVRAYMLCMYILTYPIAYINQQIIQCNEYVFDLLPPKPNICGSKLNIPRTIGIERLCSFVGRPSVVFSASS